MTSQKFEPRTYTVSEAAQILGVGRATLYNAVASGKADQLRPIEVAGCIRFLRSAVDDLTT